MRPRPIATRVASVLISNAAVGFCQLYVDTYNVPQDPAGGGEINFSVFDDSNFPGDNAALVTAQTPQDCAAQCAAANPTLCYAFVLDMSTNTCYFKLPGVDYRSAREDYPDLQAGIIEGGLSMLPATSDTCDEDYGAYHTVASGGLFSMYCGWGMSGGDLDTQSFAVDIDHCIEICDKTADCYAVAYELNMDHGLENCYLKAYDHPEPGAADGIRLDAAVYTIVDGPASSSSSSATYSFDLFAPYGYPSTSSISPASVAPVQDAPSTASAGFASATGVYTAPTSPLAASSNAMSVASSNAATITATVGGVTSSSSSSGTQEGGVATATVTVAPSGSSDVEANAAIGRLGQWRRAILLGFALVAVVL